MVGRIYHVGLTVSDLERSIAFYRDVLGLEFQGEIFMEGEETDKMFRRVNCKASRLCATCGHRGIACHLATAPKMAQKNRGPYSGTSVSLAFLMPSAVASITTSSFSFMEFRRTSMCFLQELDLAPPSA